MKAGGTVPCEILKALGELKAGQDSLRAELLGAVRQSNEAVLGAMQALATRVDAVEAGVKANHRLLVGFNASPLDAMLAACKHLKVDPLAAIATATPPEGTAP